jgi:glycerol-3-phosphate dehydrogenase (NAD(P)+)
VFVLSEVLKRVLSSPLCALSGPNFAREIAMGQLSASVIACEDQELARDMANLLCSDVFNVVARDDMISAQIAGAIKNVIAVACGIVASVPEFAQNTKAAVVSLGMRELSAMSSRYGGKVQTLMGLSGVGDVFLTCFSEQSRNTRFGMEVGRALLARDVKKVEKGRLVDVVQDIIEKQKQVVEGYSTARPAYTLTKKLALYAPLIEAVYNILYEAGTISLIERALLTRL